MRLTRVCHISSSSNPLTDSHWRIGVQDMACDTFIKIAKKCRRHFVILQSQETEPFVEEILRSLHRITVDLSPQQVHTFYEAIGYMIAAQPNKVAQEKLIGKLMELPNNAVDSSVPSRLVFGR
jgi:exportin-1